MIPCDIATGSAHRLRAIASDEAAPDSSPIDVCKKPCGENHIEHDECECDDQAERLDAGTGQEQGPARQARTAGPDGTSQEKSPDRRSGQGPNLSNSLASEASPR